MEFLEFIFQNDRHFFGIVLLLWIVVAGIEQSVVTHGLGHVPRFTVASSSDE